MKLGRLLLKLYVAGVLVFLYVPVAVLVVYSFSASRYTGVWGGFTTEWYRRLLADAEVWGALRNSLTVALASALVSSLLGLLLAYSAVRGGYRGSGFKVYFYTPIVIPEIAEAVSLMMFFYLAGVELGWLTVFIGHTAFNISYAYVTVRSQLQLLSPSIEDAARVMGASTARVFREIVVPLSMPGIVAALMITFISSFEDFVKTVFTTGPGFETLPLLIWTRAARARASPDLNALAFLMIIWSLAVAFIYIKIVGVGGEKEG